MGSRGKRKKGRLNESQWIDQYIKGIEGDKGISNATRQELTNKARESLSTFEADADGGIANYLSARQTFMASQNELSSTLEQAREGRAPKFRARQGIERRRKLKADRPGQMGFILSRGK